MGTQKDAAPIIDINYGCVQNINKDVDLFKTFYLDHFRKRAFSIILKRERSRTLLFCIGALITAILSGIPMLINVSSLYARILLALGCILLVVSGYYLKKFLNAPCECEEKFSQFMDDEFNSSRSKTKRIFHIRLYDEKATVKFGIATKIAQKRLKRYDEIAAIIETDELLFIQGLTWISRFQLEDAQFNDICALFKEKCPDVYEKKRSSSSHRLEPRNESAICSALPQA